MFVAIKSTQLTVSLLGLGKEYWRFDSKNDPPVSSRYPKAIKNWIGLPSNIDAAFKWENGLTYFFKGTNYYRFNDADFEVFNHTQREKEIEQQE